MRPNLRFWSLGTLLITALAAPTAPAAAPDTSPDGNIDTAWANMARELNLDLGSQSFTLHIGDLANGSDLQRYHFDARTASLHWSLQGAADDKDIEVPPVNGTLRLNALLEYEDTDGDGRLSLVDNIERNVRGGDLLFPWITAHEPTAGQQQVNVRYTLPDLQRGTITLRFLFTETSATIGNQTLWPSEARLAIEIDRYQYRRANHTQLAIDLRIQNDPELHDNALFPAGHHGYRPHFHWNQTALVDGTLTPVRSTFERADDGTDATNGDGPVSLLAIAYPRGATIEHRTHIGHTHTLSESPFVTIGGRILGEWRVFALGLLIAAVLVGGAAYPHIRSRL